MFDDIWAKSPIDESAHGQSLIAHTKAVLDRLVALRDRQPDLGLLCNNHRLWHWAGLACSLHDLGKCAPGFQLMLRSGPRFEERHEVISLALLAPLLSSSVDDDLSWVAAGIASHHRDLAQLRQLYDPGDEAMDLPDGCARLPVALTPQILQQMWLMATEQLIPAARARGLLQPGCEEASAQPPEFADFASWVPINVRRALDAVEQLGKQAVGTSKHALACRFLRGLVLLSDHAASADEEFGEIKALSDPSAMLAALFSGFGSDNCYEHQGRAQKTLGNAILVAPTGSGKTESALLWASNRGKHSKGHPSLFYVLPYQASLNAMRARLGRSLGDSSVVLQHSRALQALYRQLLDRGYSSDDAKRTAVRERALARLHTAPIRVTTPYQLLRGAFQLKGHAALWTDAATSTFVVDEIHAYEPVRLGMILEMLSHLAHDLGAGCFIMSATLPSLLRDELHDVANQASHIEASVATFDAFKRHRINVANSDLLDDAQVDEITSAARTGQSVLVVATTVARAQEIWQRLRSPSRLGPQAFVELLHGRFCGRDRFEKEQRVFAAAATGKDRVRPVVLVATQVVEVSLDVDFDVLFSDPAPLEALLQRFGRVNRARRLKVADVIIMNRIPESSPVYSEQLVRSAIKILSSVDGEIVNESGIQSWLDQVYSGEFGRQWEEEVKRARRDFRRDVLDSLSVFDSSPELEKRFDSLFDGSEVLPACLLQEYELLSERDPLLAPALLVPVTSGQAAMLQRQGRLRQLADGIRVANVGYDSELGLALGSNAPEGI